jgi:hypothetical protein
VVLSLSDAVDFSSFDVTKFVESVSNTTSGTAVGHVKVTQTEYTVEYTFSFANVTDVTAAGVKTAVANQCGVSESAVTVTLPGGRRLFGGRRLTAGTAEVNVKSTNASAVVASRQSASNPTAFVSQLNTVLSLSLPVPAVTPPKLGVQVSTKIISTSQTPVAAPDSTQLTTKLASTMNVNVTSTVGPATQQIPTMSPTGAPTSAPTAAPTATPTQATLAPTAAPTATTKAPTTAPASIGNTSAPTAAPTKTDEQSAAAPLSWSALAIFLSMLTIMQIFGIAV